MLVIKKCIQTGIMIFSDFGEIFLSPYSFKRRTKIFFVFIKILFFQFFISKLFEIKYVSFFNYKIETFNFYNFYYLFREIFILGTYYSEKKPNYIIDCGANIGITTLYFKWLWPDVHIDCFEPDTKTFDLLKKNIAQNNIQNVVLYHEAVSDTDGHITMYSDKKRPGSLKMSTIKERVDGIECEEEEVSSRDLAMHIGLKEIDILKMDIEGAEYDVLVNLATHGVLKNVKEFFVEYHHNIPGQKHTFSDFLRIFENNNKSYIMKTSIPNYKLHKTEFQDVLIYIC